MVTSPDDVIKVPTFLTRALVKQTKPQPMYLRDVIDFRLSLPTHRPGSTLPKQRPRDLTLGFVTQSEQEQGHRAIAKQLLKSVQGKQNRLCGASSEGLSSVELLRPSCCWDNLVCWGPGLLCSSVSVLLCGSSQLHFDLVCWVLCTNSVLNNVLLCTIFNNTGWRPGIWELHSHSLWLGHTCHRCCDNTDYWTLGPMLEEAGARANA